MRTSGGRARVTAWFPRYVRNQCDYRFPNFGGTAIKYRQCNFSFRLEVDDKCYIQRAHKGASKFCIKHVCVLRIINMPTTGQHYDTVCSKFSIIGLRMNYYWKLCPKIGH